MRPAKIDPWAKEFREMIAHGIPKQDIKETMQWYCANLQGKYVPQAYSAKAFRDKYPAIRQRYIKSLAKDKPDISRVMQPGDLHPGKELPLYEDLQNYYWPKGSKEQLPYVVHHSIMNFREFKRRAKESYDKMPHSMQAFDECVQEGEWRADRDSLGNYFIKLFERLVRWEDWSGDLTAFIWAPDIKQVQQTGKQLATNFGNDSTLFDRYLEVLGYAR